MAKTTKNDSRVSTKKEFDSPPAHVASEESPKEVKAEIAHRNFERTFSKTREIISDVFRLEAAPVKKQVGIESDFDKDPDSFRDFDHTHVFRTFDSDGKMHTRCCSTAGHFHDIEWEKDADGKPFVKSVSGPKVMARKQIKGKWSHVSVPANNYDEHVHDVTYLQSHKVQARTTNLEATKVVAANAQLGANPGSVAER